MAAKEIPLAGYVSNLLNRVEVAQTWEQFQDEDRTRTAALELSVLPGIAEACSYMYAALILQSVISEGTPITDRGSKLVERATLLDLHVPNTYEICGTGSARDCIRDIACYAEKLAIGRTKNYS